jgi:hypothetical protein
MLQTPPASGERRSPSIEDVLVGEAYITLTYFAEPLDT